MKVIILYILILSFSLIHNQEYGDTCISKHVIYAIDDLATDNTLAHHKVASCASLYPYSDDEEEIDPDEPPKMCCYSKVKYKIAGEKFTSKGCYEVEATENMNIDDEINTLKEAFQEALKVDDFYDQNYEVTDIEADIDCNSKFLKYSVLLILIALF